MATFDLEVDCKELSLAAATMAAAVARYANVSTAHALIAGMEAENRMAWDKSQPPPYRFADFENVLGKYGLVVPVAR